MMSNLITKVDQLIYGGLAIGRHNGKVVMISGGVIPGETVEVVIKDDKRDFFSAVVNKINESSPRRIKPECDYFGICGGCHYQHMPYDMQVNIKEAILRDCLKRGTNMDGELAEPVISDEQWNYRLRAQFKVSGGRVGFHKKGTRKVVAVDTCPLMNRRINQFMPGLVGILEKFKMREIHITGDSDLLAQIIFRRHELSNKDADILASELFEAGLAGVTILVGENKRLHYGKASISLNLLGLNYTVSPAAFIQNNWNLNQSVIRTIKETLGDLSGKRILDMYAGAGNFSLALADYAAVTAVEGNRFSIVNGKQNVKSNRIKNYRFVYTSAEDFQSEEYYDIVILDPPRPGVSRSLMRNILALMPERIVYISCNPSTLARDLSKLQELYHVESVRMIDFFPQTLHIESLVFLRLKG